MLLSPLAARIAEPARPADVQAMVRLAGMFSGRLLPGGRSLDDPAQREARSKQLLHQRIKFYYDSGSPARLRPSPDTEEASEKESLRFEAVNPVNPRPESSECIWRRSPEPDLWVVSTALDIRLDDGSVWGSVHTRMSRDDWWNEDSGVFAVRGGIISFIRPREVSEGDFYADEQARPHALSLETGEEMRPCLMAIRTSGSGDEWPPELTLALLQSNAGEESDFLCRAQCVLSYAWDGGQYELSGKYCAGREAWGIWPYSPERLAGINRSGRPEAAGDKETP
jgi:hypothetical protein